MNKQRATELSDKLETILAAFAEENNLNLKYKGSSYSTSAVAEWKPKFEFTDVSEISADSSFEKETFENAVRRTFGKIKPEWFDMEVRLYGGEIGNLREFHPRKSKYPMIVVTESGKRYKVPMDLIISQVVV